MIIVMPDASASFRGFFNDLTNTWRYEDFIFDEFIPHVEGKFRIKDTKRFRAISGLSMGEAAPSCMLSTDQLCSARPPR